MLPDLRGDAAASTFPPRSTCRPFPPREDVHGLPPKYLRHLRALLHQWLEQQVTSPRGLPGADSPTRLWDDDRLNKLERAIWEGAVVPQHVEGKRGLLDIDWGVWAVGAARRHKSWKERLVEVKLSKVEDEVRGRLAVPSTPAPSAFSTPGKTATRSPSVASANRSKAPEDAKVPEPSSVGGSESDENEERQKEWCHVITGLRGFERLVTPKREEWEVVDGDSSCRFSVLAR